MLHRADAASAWRVRETSASASAASSAASAAAAIRVRSEAASRHREATRPHARLVCRRGRGPGRGGGAGSPPAERRRVGGGARRARQRGSAAGAAKRHAAGADAASDAAAASAADASGAAQRATGAAQAGAAAGRGLARALRQGGRARARASAERAVPAERRRRRRGASSRPRTRRCGRPRAKTRAAAAHLERAAEAGGVRVGQQREVALVLHPRQRSQRRPPRLALLCAHARDLLGDAVPPQRLLQHGAQATVLVLDVAPQQRVKPVAPAGVHHRGSGETAVPPTTTRPLGIDTEPQARAAAGARPARYLQVGTQSGEGRTGIFGHHTCGRLARGQQGDKTAGAQRTQDRPAYTTRFSVVFL